MNTKIIKLDINRRLYDKIVAKQDDTKSRFLLFQLLDGAVPFNLTDRSVRVYGVKPDGAVIFNDLTVTHSTTGFCLLELTNQMLAIAGTVKLELMITEGDKKLTSIPFEMEVIKKINSNAAVESSNEFRSLLNALKEIDEWNKEFADKSGKLEELYTPRLNELGSQLDNKANLSDVRYKGDKITSEDLVINDDSKKIKLKNLSQEVKNAMTGITPIDNANPADSSVTVAKLSQDSIDFLRASNLVPKIFEWEDNDLLTVEEGFVCNYNGVKFRFIPKGLRVSIATWGLAYFDNSSQTLELKTINDWKTKDIEFFTNPNNIIVAFRSGTAKNCLYLRDLDRNADVKISGMLEDINDCTLFNHIKNVKCTHVEGMKLNVSKGILDNVKIINGGDVVLDDLGSDVKRTLSGFTVPLSPSYVYLKGEIEQALWVKNIVVKDSEGVLLTKDVDYAISEDWLGKTKISALKTSFTGTIEFDQPMCRIDVVCINKDSGGIAIKKGIETNSNPTKDMNNIPSNWIRIANVWIRWNSKTILPQNICNVSDRDIDGYTQKDLTMLPFKKEIYSNTLESLNFKIRMALNKNDDVFRNKRPIRIGFFGDSVTQNTQEELKGIDGKLYGWSMVFVDKLHEMYPDAELKMWSVNYQGELNTVRNYASKNDCLLKFELFNYAQGGHMLHNLLHSNDLHYDRNQTGRFSPLYYSGNTNYHDLFFMCRTNFCLNDYTMLKNIDMYNIFKSEPYNVNLRDISLYNDVNYGEQYMREDNAKCYKAMLKRVYNDMTKQGSEVVFTSDTPASIWGMHNGDYEAASSAQSKLTYEVARETNSIFINWLPLFQNKDEIMGIPTEAFALPQCTIHPSIYVHRFMGAKVFEIMSKV